MPVVGVWGAYWGVYFNRLLAFRVEVVLLCLWLPCPWWVVLGKFGRDDDDDRGLVKRVDNKEKKRGVWGRWF